MSWSGPGPGLKLVLIHGPGPGPVIFLVQALVPVLVPVPSYFWSQPWSRSRSKCLVPSHSGCSLVWKFFALRWFQSSSKLCVGSLEIFLRQIFGISFKIYFGSRHTTHLGVVYEGTVFCTTLGFFHILSHCWGGLMHHLVLVHFTVTRKMAGLLAGFF